MTTLAKLQALLQRDFEIPLERLTPEARLEELDIDSLRMIEILFSIEDTFGITISADQAELKARLHTLGDLADYVDTVLAGKESGAPP
jgi:acyl carrier protein